MIRRKLLTYGVVVLVIFVILSCISIYRNWGVLCEYFSSTFSSVLGIGLYLMIFAVGIGLMLKALFR